MFFAKFSPAFAVYARLKKSAAPEKSATPTSISAMIHRCLDKYLYLSPPSTESTVNRKICGVREFNPVVTSEASTATRKYFLEPWKNRNTRSAFLCFVLIILLCLSQQFLY